MEVDESLHYMQLPREVIVGKNVLGRVGEVCARLGFTGTALVVSGPVTYPIAGEPVAKSVTKAGLKVDHVRRDAFGLISSRVKASVPISEYEVQQFVLERFAQSGLVTNHGPIVAVNANASNPHYEPGREKTSLIDRRDLVLIDMWAKLNRPNAVYYDITWTGFCGENIPDEIRNVFGVVQTARGKACDFVIHRVSQAQSVQGWEVDVAARSHIDAEGYGEFFFHRTGHSIGTDVHGTGANGPRTGRSRRR